jgi:hypothetical protein
MDFHTFNDRCIASCHNAMVGQKKCYQQASTLYVLYANACAQNEHMCTLDKIACGGNATPDVH